MCLQSIVRVVVVRGNLLQVQSSQVTDNDMTLIDGRQFITNRTSQAKQGPWQDRSTRRRTGDSWYLAVHNRRVFWLFTTERAFLLTGPCLTTLSTAILDKRESQSKVLISCLFLQEVSTNFVLCLLIFQIRKGFRCCRELQGCIYTD
jgi:hypothetical protein